MSEWKSERKMTHRISSLKMIVKEGRVIQGRACDVLSSDISATRSGPLLCLLYKWAVTRMWRDIPDFPRVEASICLSLQHHTHRDNTDAAPEFLWHTTAIRTSGFPSSHVMVIRMIEVQVCPVTLTSWLGKSAVGHICEGKTRADVRKKFFPGVRVWKQLQWLEWILPRLPSWGYKAPPKNISYYPVW